MIVWRVWKNVKIKEYKEWKRKVIIVQKRATVAIIQRSVFTALTRSVVTTRITNAPIAGILRIYIRIQIQQITSIAVLVSAILRN